MAGGGDQVTSALRAALTVYDDAALETLANRGLLRRATKDVEGGKVEIAQESPESITVIADGERVEMDAGGPRTARCTCPATSVCRQRLAAVLLLRSSQRVAADEPAAPHPVEPPAAVDALTEVRAIDANALTKWAGKANLRAALDLLADAAPEIECDGAAVRVRLGAGWAPVLILAGQGLDGIVSKAPPSRMRALHTAAVPAVWRDQGRDIEVLLDEVSAASVAEPPDYAFLATVKSTLEAALSTAIAQAPEVLEEQLFLLSVSSRADDLPALSRRLRRLSGSVRARRDRDFTMTPSDILSEIAAAYALADALATCGDATKVVQLRGAARQGYAPVGPLGLIGLAARQWETRGDARGITGYFYAPELKRTVTVGLARVGRHDRLFDPVSGFHDESLWRAGPLRELIGARVDLQGARLSPEGRLSQAQETVGWKTAWVPDTAEIRAWPTHRLRRLAGAGGAVVRSLRGKAHRTARGPGAGGTASGGAFAHAVRRRGPAYDPAASGRTGPHTGAASAACGGNRGNGDASRSHRRRDPHRGGVRRGCTGWRQLSADAALARHPPDARRCPGADAARSPPRLDRGRRHRFDQRRSGGGRRLSG
jgi:hypothetical protein